jgi:hypothetical protein
LGEQPMLVAAVMSPPAVSGRTGRRARDVVSLASAWLQGITWVGSAPISSGPDVFCGVQARTSCDPGYHRNDFSTITSLCVLGCLAVVLCKVCAAIVCTGAVAGCLQLSSVPLECVQSLSPLAMSRCASCTACCLDCIQGSQVKMPQALVPWRPACSAHRVLHECIVQTNLARHVKRVGKAFCMA